MAEPSEPYIERLCQLFCDRYNKSNGTNFVFDGKEEKQCDVDFYIRDRGLRLPVQHKRIETTPLFIKSSAQTAIVTQKLEKMGQIYRFNCTVYILFRAVPVKENEIDRFVRCFMIFLRYHLSNDSFSLRFRESDDLPTLTGIFEYLSEFKIMATGGGGFALITGNEIWEFGRTIDEEVQYYLELIHNRDSIYSPENGLILLLEMEPMPITGPGLHELRRKCTAETFNCKEIWQINLGNDGFCDKLYPVPFENGKSEDYI